MSRSVYVSGFKDLETAAKVADQFKAYHNEKHHFPGKPLYLQSEPEGHLVTILRVAGDPVLEIPLYSHEPRKHGYDTVDDVVEILRRIDPTLNRIAETINIKLEGL